MKHATDTAKKPALGNKEIDTKYIDVLDGVRALAVFGVLWFHFWQQNWIMPYINLPFLTKLGLPSTLNLDFLPRTGFLFVDWLLFLSAFCLFLPYARAALDNLPLPDTRLFFKKRIARIVPSYYLSVLVILFAVTIPSGAYASVGAGLKDAVSTLTFTQTFFPNVLIGSKINGVLWTAAVEMQFYLFFPFLARAFVKKPAWIYLGMLGVSLLYLRGFALQNEDTIRLTVNQLPAFFGVFANGMGVAYLFVLLSRHVRRDGQLSLLSLVGVIAGFMMLLSMMKNAAGASPAQIWQAQNRFRLSLVFALITVSAALTFSGVRWLFSNAVMRFLSVISYNVYIWHQWIAVRLKEWKIPYWTGEKPPNMTGDTRWQWTYTALILLATFAVAIFATYCVERPAAVRILARQPKRREPMIEIVAEEDPEEDPEEDAKEDAEEDGGEAGEQMSPTQERRE